jgi:hypothetical protein
VHGDKKSDTLLCGDKKKKKMKEKGGCPRKEFRRSEKKEQDIPEEQDISERP